MLPDLMCLLLPVPPAWATTLGYPGDNRYVAFYWTPVGDELMYTDGFSSGTGDYAPWLLWTRHLTVVPALFGFGFSSSDAEATHWLLLDQQEACFYVGTVCAIVRFLQDQPDVQAMHAAWERLSTDEQQRLLTETMERLQQTLQETPMLNLEDLEHQLRESHHRYRDLEGWLEQQPPNPAWSALLHRQFYVKRPSESDRD